MAVQSTIGSADFQGWWISCPSDGFPYFLYLDFSLGIYFSLVVSDFSQYNQGKRKGIPTMTSKFYRPQTSKCKKCGRELSCSEQETGMEKCAPCLVKGYRFVIRLLHKELDELRKK